MIKMSVSVSYILLTKTNLLKYNFIYHTFVFLFLTQTIQNSTQSLIDGAQTNIESDKHRVADKHRVRQTSSQTNIESDKHRVRQTSSQTNIEYDIQK